MNSAPSQPPEPISYVADHPEPLGRLAEVFDRRRIAMAAGADGRLVLLRPDEILVDRSDEAAFKRALERLAASNQDLADRLRDGERLPGVLTRVRLGGDSRVDGGGERRWSVDAVADAVAAIRAVDVPVMGNYVLLGSQGIRGNPVGAEAHIVGGMMFTAETTDTANGVALRTTAHPAAPPGFLRGPQQSGAKAPRVLVLDTGLRTADGQGASVEHPELGTVFVHSGWHADPDPLVIDDEDEADDDGLGYLDFEAGHGTFIAGVVRQVCPDAEIHIAGVLSSFGDGDVASMLLRLERAITEAGGAFDIVVMSLGGYMSDEDAELFGRGLLPLLGDGLGIAAAGNQASSRKYFPAALTGIVAVGALGEDGRAWFSNFGGWVDACAPGIDVVSTFFADVTEPDGPHFHWWARWSGTSFSAPKVAGAIAQEMYLTGATAKDAWTRLSDYQRYRYPDLGTVFNV